MPCLLEADDPWLAELRSIVDSKSALPLRARHAVHRVVQALVLEGCSPSDAAQAEALLLRL
jgi:hypothetical protein